MSVSRCPLSPGRRIVLIACAAGACLLAAPVTSHAQVAPTIVGSLANFDAVNDSEGEKEGFQIELEGLQVNDITRVFGQSGATCYIRYCIGSIAPYTDAITGATGVRIRWTANYDRATQTFVTPSSAPGGGSHGTPSTFGTKATLATGESCWSLGLGNAYATSGCEHFGVSTLRNATKTTYTWLKGNPADGSFAPATVVNPSGVTVPAPPVPIPHPAVLGGVLANKPDVQVAVAPPAPVALAHRYGKAQWVKVYKTEVDHDADLDLLQFGQPDVPDANGGAAATEIEWKLFQFDVKKANPDPAKDGNLLKSHGSPGNGKHAVIRRYEFFDYIGPTLQGQPPSGNPPLSTDDQENSACVRVNGDCTTAPPEEIGGFIGAQMAGQNLAANRATPLITWPTPAPIVYGTPVGAAQLNATATANGVVVPGTFAYTPAADANAILPAGTRTLQVLFTPTDTTRFTTQTMTMVLTVGKAPLTVTADSASKVYGSSDPLFTYQASGFVAGDTAATALFGALAAEVGSDVGNHAITLGSLTTTDNYALSFTPGTLAITPAPLTITAGSDSKIYGATFAPAAFTASGLLNADSVASVTLTTAGTAAGAPAGSYDIVPGAAVGTGLGNYTIAYANGTLTVTPAALSVAADAQTKVAGAIDPPLTFVASGFQAGDAAAAVLSGALTRAPGEAAGSYAITQGTLAANANYTIAFTGNAFVITAPPPPPPSSMAIAPIPPQVNTDGDEVELQVVVIRSPAAASSSHRTRPGVRGDDDTDDRDDRGRFTISGLNGLRIDNDGEIGGHIDAGVTATTTFTVTVTFTENGVTATQQIAWTVKPAPARKGRKG